MVPVLTYTCDICEAHDKQRSQLCQVIYGKRCTQRAHVRGMQLLEGFMHTTRPDAAKSLGTDLCDLCSPGLLNGFIHLEFSLLQPFIPRIHRIAFVFLAKILSKHFLAIDTYSPKLRSIVFTLVDLAALSHRVTKLKFFRDIRLFDMLSVWYPLENEHIIDEVIRYHK